MSAMILRIFGKRPVESIESILIFLALLPGIYILTPYYPPDGTVLSNTLAAGEVALKVYGAFLTGVGLIGLLAKMFNASWSFAARRAVTFSLFISYFYLTLVKIISSGFGDLTWASLLANSFTAAAVFIWLGGRRGN